MRTQEQIIQQMTARLRELEAEMETPRRRYPCSSCKYYRAGPQRCLHPMLIGLDNDFVIARDYSITLLNKLCGEEKALFEPISKTSPVWDFIRGKSEIMLLAFPLGIFLSIIMRIIIP